MTYDNELTLISKVYTEDKIGNQIAEENKNIILCGIKSIGRTEYYNAATNGLKPNKIFVIHSFEYGGETEVIFDEKRYNVIRTYGEDTEEMELVCEKVLGNG